MKIQLSFGNPYHHKMVDILKESRDLLTKETKRLKEKITSFEKRDFEIFDVKDGDKETFREKMLNNNYLYSEIEQLVKIITKELYQFGSLRNKLGELSLIFSLAVFKNSSKIFVTLEELEKEIEKEIEKLEWIR